MAFKQKSGSPFQRNFGVGNSPVKDMKKGVEIDGLPHNTNSEDKTGKLSEDHDERKHPDKSPAKQKSPLEIEEGSMTKKLEKIERPDKSGERKKEVGWKETSREKISSTSSAGKKGRTHKITLTSPTGGTKIVYS